MLPCDVQGCTRAATVVLEFRGQPGHVHVCPQDEATDREWCDVTASHPLPCPWRCENSTQPTAIGQAIPTSL